MSNVSIFNDDDNDMKDKDSTLLFNEIPAKYALSWLLLFYDKKNLRPKKPTVKVRKGGIRSNVNVQKYHVQENTGKGL